MDNNFELNLAKDKQRLCAKIALRRAKRVFALLKAGRLQKIDKSDLEELLLHFDIYCGIFEDAVKQEKEINEAEARRLLEFRKRQVVNG
jgi:hypothetical protein